ncbi:MAG: hypothetical protein R3F17_03975 [Planctomycetota bacterium]
MRRTSRPTLLAALTLLGAMAFAGRAQAQGQARDQVTYRNDRGDRVTTVKGTIEENSLTGVKVRTGEGTVATLDSGQVLRVVFGEVPDSYREARTWRARGDMDQALAQFRAAASDAESAAVKASARMEAVRCLMRIAAKDATRFAEAATEADRYMSDFATGREVPEAMRTKARALWLQGKAGEAADLYSALYDKGRTGTAGYPTTLCLEAALDGAWAALDNNDTGKARELFTACKAGFEAAAKDATGADASYLTGLAASADCGEGFCLLASGDKRGARSFFERRRSQDLHPSGLALATLGLAESLLADGQAGDAQVHFATVSALDPTSRDRTARAMLGLAQSLKAVGSPTASEQVPILLAKIKGVYGDTPAALKAGR